MCVVFFVTQQKTIIYAQHNALTMVSVQEGEAGREEGAHRRRAHQLAVRVKRRKGHRAFAQVDEALRDPHQHQRFLE